MGCLDVGNPTYNAVIYKTAFHNSDMIKCYDRSHQLFLLVLSTIRVYINTISDGIEHNHSHYFLH